jgi:hypothetical protein
VPARLRGRRVNVADAGVKLGRLPRRLAKAFAAASAWALPAGLHPIAGAAVGAPPGALEGAAAAANGLVLNEDLVRPARFVRNHGMHRL